MRTFLVITLTTLPILSRHILAKNQKAVITAKLVLDFIRRYGFPETIHFDQGLNFLGKVMKNLYKLTRIKQTKITPYHPIGNGLSERFNQTLLSMVGTLTSKKKKAWPKYLPDLVMAYNSATHWKIILMISSRTTWKSSQQHMILLPERLERLNRNKRNIVTKVEQRKHQISWYLALKFL